MVPEAFCNRMGMEGNHAVKQSKAVMCDTVVDPINNAGTPSVPCQSTDQCNSTLVTMDYFN